MDATSVLVIVYKMWTKVKKLNQLIKIYIKGHNCDRIMHGLYGTVFV